MESKFFTIASKRNPFITIQTAAGHFATGSSHISHYIDIGGLKSRASLAKAAAREMAVPYLKNSESQEKADVDVIVYMDGTEIIAAYLADELIQNNHGEIHVLTPMKSSSGHFIFHENVQGKIANKNVVLMVASMSTGATVNRAAECISYYGGKLVGISAVFSTSPEIDGWKVHSLFSYKDIPDYRFYRAFECEMCKTGDKIEAIINSEGYTKL